MSIGISAFWVAVCRCPLRRDKGLEGAGFSLTRECWVCQTRQSLATSILSGKRGKKKIRTREISPFSESCALGLCVCVHMRCEFRKLRKQVSKSWAAGSTFKRPWVDISLAL